MPWRSRSPSPRWWRSWCWPCSPRDWLSVFSATKLPARGIGPMSTLADFIQRLPGKSALRVAAILLVLSPGAALQAAPSPQAPDRPPATAQERGDLRRTIEARYQVLPVSGGVLLTPRQAKAGVRTVEVTGGRIAVNGETVTARTVRDWLGADADPVLRLLGM